VSRHPPMKPDNIKQVDCFFFLKIVMNTCLYHFCTSLLPSSATVFYCSTISVRFTHESDNFHCKFTDREPGL
jgi:hypothetical protein